MNCANSPFWPSASTLPAWWMRRFWPLARLRRWTRRPGASSSHVVPAGGKHWRAHLTEALQALPRAAASHGWGGGVEGPPAADKQRQQQHFHHHHQGQQQNQHQASSSGHARKFADRSSIEERLGGQLAGMRRRATLKQTMI